MLRRKVEDLMALYGDVWVKKDDSRLGDVFTSNVVYVEKPTFRVHGLNEMKQYWKKHIHPMTDIQYLPYLNEFDVHEEEGWAWVKFCCSFRKNGKPNCNIWVAKIRVSNGRISHFEEYWATASAKDEARLKSVRKSRESNYRRQDSAAYHIDVEANQHLRYRDREDMNSCGLHADFVKRGDMVKGYLSSDGLWLKVGERFLPAKIKGKSVMHPVVTEGCTTSTSSTLTRADFPSGTSDDVASGVASKTQADFLAPEVLEVKESCCDAPTPEQDLSSRTREQRRKPNKIKVASPVEAGRAPPKEDEFWVRKLADENRKILSGTFVGTVAKYNTARGWGNIVPHDHASFPDLARKKAATKVGKIMLYFRKPDVTEAFEALAKSIVEFEVYVDDKGAGACNIRPAKVQCEASTLCKDGQ